MLDPNRPALILAPMDGITDAPMRALQGATGAFSFAVSEFVRASASPIPARVFKKEVPELLTGGLTATGLPVQVQILGGDPELLALSALQALKAGAKAIDLNFGCPAKTVNRHDGGASLLKHPKRIREIVATVRGAVPKEIPVSAKIRLGWDSIDDVHENAAMVEEGGATWLTVHARTRAQAYDPPVYWEPVGQVREAISIPVVANGDIWTLEDFLRCRDVTGCDHFMIGRGAMAEPRLPGWIAQELGLSGYEPERDNDWPTLLRSLIEFTKPAQPNLTRLKQWLRLAHSHGAFAHFDEIKQTRSAEELLGRLDRLRAVGPA